MALSAANASQLDIADFWDSKAAAATKED